MNRKSPRNRRALVSCWVLFAALLATSSSLHGAEIERRVYIPSSELNVLSREGKPGILLTQEEYQRLLAEAGAEEREPVAIPFAARLESVNAEAIPEHADTWSDESLRVKAVFSVRVLSATWGEIPFEFQGAAPISVMMDGRWFIVPPKNQAASHLFVYGAGLHTIEVEFLTGVEREAGERRVAFSLPPAPSGNLMLRLPAQSDVRTQLPVQVTQAEKETRAEFSLGGETAITFAWFPSITQKTDRATALFAQSHLAYGVRNGLIRITGTILFNTLIGNIPERVSFLLPQKAAIRQLSGRGFLTTDAAPLPRRTSVGLESEASALRGWSVSDREVIVDRAPGKADGLELNVEIEIPFKLGGGIPLPVIQIPRVFRHYGELALVGDPGIQIHVEEISHLERMEIPAFFGEQVGVPGQHLSAYRYFAEPVSLTFRAQTVEPEMEATVGSWVVFRKDAVYRQRYLEILQKKGECRRLAFALPRQEELIRLLDAQDQEIEAVETPRDDAIAYEIELPEALEAGMGKAFTIESRIDPPGYLELDATGILVSLDPIRLDGAARLSGTIAVGADADLRLTDLEKGNLDPAPRPAEHSDALQSFFFRDAYELSIRVSPRPSHLNAIVLLDLLPKERFLTVHGEIRYLVEGAARKHFSLAFPSGLGAAFFPEGDLLKEKSLSEEADRDIWELVTQDAVEGEFRVHFVGDIPMEGTISAPEVSVPEARRERGFIVIEANTETEIEFEASGLASLDILDVPQMATYQPKQRLIGAYQYVVHPYALRLRVTRHEGEPVLRVIADRLDLLTVVSPDGFTRSRAVYQLRGVRTSFLNVELPRASVLWSANVGGEPVKPMHGPDGLLRIPVSDSLRRGRPVAVDLVYESPAKELSAAGDVEFLAPKLAEGIPVAQTQWHLFLPREYIYRDFDSDLQLVDQPPPEPILLSFAGTASNIVAWPFEPRYQMAMRPPGAPQALHEARSSRPAVELETAASDRDASGEGAIYELNGSGSLLGVAPEALRSLGYVDSAGRPDSGIVTGASSWGALTRAAEDGVDEMSETLTDLRTSGLSEGKSGEKLLEKERIPPPEETRGGIIVGRREAGILPFRIKLTPRGVEYVFHGLRQGERVAMHFRRVQNWNAWNVFIVIAAALIFAAVVRERNALKGTIWAVLILTALPYAVGRDWTPFCNRLLVGILLGAALILVTRIRKRWVLRAAGIAAASIAVFTFLGAVAQADTVYIPYDPAHPEAATQATRVYVPYERFEELWRLAKARREAATEEPAPIDYALEDAQYVITLSEESADITARYRLYLPEQKWITIPFPFTGAEISEARLDGEPARIGKNEGHYLLYAREKGSHTVEFHMTAPGGTEKPTGTLALGIPSTFASQVRVILPRKDLTADIQPYQGGRVVSIKENRKQIVVGLGKADRLRVRWYPEVSRDRPTVPLSANVLAHHSIVGTIENWSATLNLDFPGEKKSSFEFELDNTLQLTSIKVPNLKQWTVREQNGRRTLEVQLSEEATDSVAIEILAERTEESAGRSVPMVVVPSARETITKVALSAAPWLDVRVEAGPFRRIIHSVQEIPGLSLIGVFETHHPGDRLTYQLKERSQEIKWELHYLFQVESRKIEEIVMVKMEVKHRPLFGLAVALPRGYRCDRIEGEEVKDWWESPAGAEAGSRIEIEFQQGILGQSTMILALIRHFPDQPEVLSTEPISLIPPRELAKSSIQGSVLIASHVSVQPRPVEEVGLKSTSLCEDELAVGDCKVGGGFAVSLPLERKLAYWFETPDFSASFALERVEPRESVVWVTLAEAHETWIAYSTHIHWQLRQGSRRSWQFTAPADLGEILVTGKSVREVSWEDAGDLRRYTVDLDQEVFDSERFVLSYESPIQQTARVPQLRFPDADRASGYILTANASPYELSAVPIGSLNTAQKSDIPFLPKETGVLGYYKLFGGEWDLELRLIRTVAAETLPAVIDWVEIETQLRRDGTALNVLTLRMQNKTLQFLPVLLPEGARLLSLAVAGQATRANQTVRNGRETLLVPLIKTEPGDLSYEIRIVYEGSASDPPGLHQRLSFDDPRIMDIPVTQTFWTFYVPDEYSIHYVRGNMEETAQAIRDVVKLSAMEEERQHLKTIITGEYALKKKARALSNYMQLQQEIVSEQGGIDINTIQRDLQENKRLKGKAQVLEQDVRRISSGISSNIISDTTGTFQKRFQEVSRQIQARKPEIEGVETSRKILEQAREKGWLRNDDFDFELEGIQPPESRDKAIIHGLGGGELTQVGSNVFIQTGQLEGKRKSVETARQRETAVQYFNLSQGLEQQAAFANNIDMSNAMIVEDLGLAPGKDVEGYFQRVGGRFTTAPVAAQAPVSQPQAKDEDELPAQPPTEGQTGVVEKTAAAEGSYSIPIYFPRQGKAITFKKLQSDAEVRFTVLDRRVKAKSAGIALLVVAALFLHIVMGWIGNWTITHRLRERMGY